MGGGRSWWWWWAEGGGWVEGSRQKYEVLQSTSIVDTFKCQSRSSQGHRYLSGSGSSMTPSCRSVGGRWAVGRSATSSEFGRETAVRGRDRLARIDYTMRLSAVMTPSIRSSVVLNSEEDKWSRVSLSCEALDSRSSINIIFAIWLPFGGCRRTKRRKKDEDEDPQCSVVSVFSCDS